LRRRQRGDQKKNKEETTGTSEKKTCRLKTQDCRSFNPRAPNVESNPRKKNDAGGAKGNTEEKKGNVKNCCGFQRRQRQIEVSALFVQKMNRGKNWKQDVRRKKNIK